MTCWVGSKSVVNVQVAVEDNFLDYYVIIGNIKEILSQYTDITGKGVVPPKWSFGYWQSKISYKSAEETLEIAKSLREAEIPCDVIHLDTHWFKEEGPKDFEKPDAEPEVDLTDIFNMASDQFKGEIDNLKGKIDALKKELEKKDESLKSMKRRKVHKIVPKKNVKLAPPKIKIPVLKTLIKP
ncbi:unnamed protein product, partial [marine sediment metagenome]